jgi:hypothetical protein
MNIKFEEIAPKALFKAVQMKSKNRPFYIKDALKTQEAYVKP